MVLYHGCTKPDYIALRCPTPTVSLIQTSAPRELLLPSTSHSSHTTMPPPPFCVTYPPASGQLACIPVRLSRSTLCSNTSSSSSSSSNWAHFPPKRERRPHPHSRPMMPRCYISPFICHTADPRARFGGVGARGGGVYDLRASGGPFLAPKGPYCGGVFDFSTAVFSLSGGTGSFAWGADVLWWSLWL